MKIPFFNSNLSPQRLDSELLADDVTKHQRLYCRFRRECLVIADTARWKSFSCKSCNAYKRLTEQEVADETDAILNMLAVVSGLK